MRKSLLVVCLAFTGIFFISAQQKAVVPLRCYSYVLEEIFGEKGSGKRTCLKGTIYYENLFTLEEELSRIAIDLTQRFAQEWPYVKTEKMAFLYHITGSSITSKECRRIIGTVSYRAYMAKRAQFETQRTHVYLIRKIFEHMKSSIEEAILGKKGCDHHTLLKMVLADHTKTVQKRLLCVPVDYAKTVKVDWDEQKKVLYTYLHTFFSTTYVSAIHILKIPQLLEIAHIAYTYRRMNLV